jgi:hypothetical protein
MTINPIRLDSEFDPVRVAYIKPVNGAEAHKLGLIPPGIELPPDATIYVLHLGDGSIIGLTEDRESAYGAMVQNDLIPVTLH